MDQTKSASHKWMHLCIDVQKDACDPAFYQPLIDSGVQSSNTYTSHLPTLDRVAQDIAKFTEKTRDNLPPIWVYSRYAEMEQHAVLGAYFQNQGVPHHVVRQTQDPVLEKHQMSAVPDNADFFTKLKAAGVKGFVVTGLFAADCVLNTIKDLQKNGFEVVVVQDLVEAALPAKKAEGLAQIQASGAALETQKSIIEKFSPAKQSATYSKFGKCTFLSNDAPVAVKAITPMVAKPAQAFKR